MIKLSALNINKLTILLAVAVGSTISGFVLGTNNGAIAKAVSSVSPLQSDEKVVERKEFSNEPFEFDNLSIKKIRMSPGTKFNATSLAEKGGGHVEAWLEDLAFTIKNRSNKQMTYINVELDFPETTSNGSMMVYNQLGIGIHPKAFGDGLKNGALLALDPGHTTTFTLSAQRLQVLKEFLASRNFQLADLNQVIIRVDQVIFDDGTKWSQGDHYRPNPAARGGYERINPTIQ